MVTTGYFEQMLFLYWHQVFIFFSWYSTLYSTLRLWEKKIKSSREGAAPQAGLAVAGTPHCPAAWKLSFCLCSWPQAGQGGFPCQGLDKMSYLVGSHTLLLFDTKRQFGHCCMKRAESHFSFPDCSSVSPGRRLFPLACHSPRSSREAISSALLMNYQGITKEQYKLLHDIVCLLDSSE